MSSGTKISFGVKTVVRSKVDETKVVDLTTKEDSDEEERERELERETKRRKLEALENGAIPEDADDRKAKTALVIPMVIEVDWRVKKLQEMETAGTISDEDKARLAILLESHKDAIEVLGDGTQDDGEQKSIAVDMERITAEDADYAQVPVESFGLAMLRGCGWKDGEGIGRSNKRVVPLRIPDRRPKGLGLGAVPKNQKNDGKTAADNGKGGETKLELKIGAAVRIEGGAHRDSYGRVEAQDADNAAVYVKLALGGTRIRVSEYAIVVVSEREYERDAKCINKSTYEKAKQTEETTSDRKRPTNGGDSKSDGTGEKKRRKERGGDSDIEVEAVRLKSWVCAELIVRLVDKAYKDGKYFNQKMRVTDVAGRNNITLLDEAGKFHYDMRESWLETVVPRKIGDPVLLLAGKLKGQMAIVEFRDKSKEVVHVRLRDQLDGNLQTATFDEVCACGASAVD